MRPSSDGDHGPGADLGSGFYVLRVDGPSRGDMALDGASSTDIFAVFGRWNESRHLQLQIPAYGNAGGTVA